MLIRNRSSALLDGKIDTNVMYTYTHDTRYLPRSFSDPISIIPIRLINYTVILYHVKIGENVLSRFASPLHHFFLSLSIFLFSAFSLRIHKYTHKTAPSTVYVHYNIIYALLQTTCNSVYPRCVCMVILLLASKSFYCRTNTAFRVVCIYKYKYLNLSRKK